LYTSRGKRCKEFRRHSARTVPRLRTASNKICAHLSCQVARALWCGLYHAPIRIYRNKHQPGPGCSKKSRLGQPNPAGIVNSRFLPGVSNEPSRPVTCCTLPANRSQRCMTLFSSHLAGSAGRWHRVGHTRWPIFRPPSLSCPVWAGRIAARQVTPACRARPASHSNEEFCRPPSLVRLG
jgi:hypothetical protein